MDLSWNASSSTVAGYNVYRGNQSAGPFTKLNASLDASTTYTDISVQRRQDLLLRRDVGGWRWYGERLLIRRISLDTDTVGLKTAEADATSAPFASIPSVQVFVQKFSLQFRVQFPFRLDGCLLLQAHSFERAVLLESEPIAIAVTLLPPRGLCSLCRSPAAVQRNSDDSISASFAVYGEDARSWARNWFRTRKLDTTILQGEVSL